MSSCSGMVYEDAEKLYAEVRADTESLTEDALRVIYPGSCSLSSASSGPHTLFAHNTTPFTRRDVVRVPVGSTAHLLQTTSDGKGGYVVMEGKPGGGLVLPSHISAHDLKGAYAFASLLEYVLTAVGYKTSWLKARMENILC
jgi:alpha-mannosidase